LFSDKLKKVSFFLLPSLVSAVVPVITLPIYSRAISVSEYGIYALCIAFATFVSGLSNMGLTTGYERNFFEQNSPAQHGQLIFSIVLFVITVYFLFGIPLYFFRSTLSGWIIGDKSHGIALLLAYAAVSLSTLKTYFLLYYRNIGNAKAYAWFSIDEIILNVLISIVLVVYFKMGVLGLIVGQLTSALFVIILLGFRFRKLLPFGLSGDMMKKCFAISLPLTPRIFFGVIGTQFDKYMIGLLSSLGGVGLYNLGQKIAYVVFNYMTALQNVFSPVVYRMMFEQGQDEQGAIGRYLTFPFFVSALGGLGLSIFSEEIVYLLTPSEYHGASDMVAVLSMMYVIYFFGKQPQLIYAKKTSVISWLTMISIALNISINIPFIMKWGALGAAYGTLLSAVISVSITFIVFQKYFHIKWEWAKIAYIIILLFAFSFLHIFLRYLNVDWMLRIFVKCAMIITYVYGAYLLKVFNIEQLKFILPKKI
jgi:O-antigen/teichoic acid export membrane protein